MATNTGILSKLFRSLAPDEQGEQAARQVATSAAEQRWPLLQSAKPRMLAATPALTMEEKQQAWAPAAKPAHKERKRSLYVPQSQETLAGGLSKLSERASLERGTPGETGKRRERRKAQVSAPVPAAPAIDTYAPVQVNLSVPAQQESFEKEPRKPSANEGSQFFAVPPRAPDTALLQPKPTAVRSVMSSETPAAVSAGAPVSAPVSTPVSAPAVALPTAQQPAPPPLEVRATVRTAPPAADNSLKSVFGRLRGEASPASAPAPSRPSFMNRMGKR